MPIAGPIDSANPSARLPVHFLVTPRFFSTVRASIVRGREIDDGDSAGYPWVAVVNETMASRYWPGQEALGKTFTIDTVPEERPRLIVGIVRDLPTRREQIEPEPVFYTSYLQQPSRVRAPWAGMPGRMTLFVRAASDPASVAADIRRAAADVEPDRPLTAVATAGLGDYFWMRQTHIFATAGFAIVAVLLAAIGVYGVTAYALGQRRREIAVRVALGADARDVVRTLGLPSLAVVGSGLAAGAAGAVAFGRVVESQLWGVSSTDLPTFGGAAFVIVAAAALACLGPLRRALALDPSMTLRSE
jgi:hypothetical protein